MDAHSAMDEWEPSPFDGGLEEAARLADRGFSGAIESGPDRLFIADGEPVAVVTDFETAPTAGAVDAFEDASGTALEAPHPAVARLVPMLALGGEVRGEYFSDDTPVGTVEETLADGAFTGYVELAENVLSGDYYVVFEDGEAEYAAFIGSTERLATGSEAESKTKNEVGIYTVTAVDLPDVELPDPPSGAGAGAGAAGGVAADTDTGSTAAGDTDAAAGTDAADTDVGGTEAAATDTGGTDASPDQADTETDDAIGIGTSTDSEPSAPAGETAGGSASESDAGVGTADAEPLGSDASESADGPDAAGDDGISEERTVPSVDPERTSRTDDAETGTATGGGGIEVGSGTDASDEDRGTADDATGTASGASAGAVDALRSEIKALRSSVARLEGRVAALETAEGTDGAAAARTDGPSLTASEALSKTTLFVREGTRGGPTLEDAHDGRADRDALSQNLEFEWHTRFDETGATVDGEPFESFITGTQAYEFVEWLTTDLLFEIRVTNTEAAMAHCYDAIPEIDRVFFDETVSVDDGAESFELTFDVVVRDRNGAPLFVATLDDSREPTPSSRIETLVTDASDLCAASKSLGGAFAVTASYFEPEALDAAREATTSSLLSREKHLSFVNLTRKNGFHLGLVEAREGRPHLTLPEL